MVTFRPAIIRVQLVANVPERQVFYRPAKLTKSSKMVVSHDYEAVAKTATCDWNQCAASFDDAETLKTKVDYAKQRCLGG